MVRNNVFLQSSIFTVTEFSTMHVECASGSSCWRDEATHREEGDLVVVMLFLVVGVVV